MNFASSQLTLTNVISYLATLAASHKNIHNFGYGPIYDITNQKDNVLYPYLWVEPQTSTVHKDHIELKLKLFLIDQVDYGNVNRQQVHSDTFNTLLQLRAFIYKDLNTFLLPTDDSDVEPLWEKFDNFTAGWSLYLNLKFDWRADVCTIPGLYLSGVTFQQSTDFININLTPYMPLAGGVFTGPISGTCGTFDCFSATSFSAGTIFSGSTDLNNIFLSINAAISSATTAVQSGLNTYTGGTILMPTINVSGGTVNNWNVTGGTLSSGGTDLYSIFITTNDGNDITRVQPGLNTYTGGTGNLPTVNISAATLNNAFISGATTANTLTTLEHYLVDQPVPTPPVSGSLILQSFNQQGFSVPHIYDTQGNAIEITRDNILIARNVSGTGYTKGQVVYASGATGTVPTIQLAKANSLNTIGIIGVCYENIANNSFGRVMTLGNVENINLSAFNNGDAVYVSPTTAGDLTNIKPSYPNYAQKVGYVLNNGIGNGVLGVYIRGVEGIYNGDANAYITALSATSVQATIVSGGTYYSGSTPLSTSIVNIAGNISGTSASLWSSSTGSNSIIANNGSGNLASGAKALAAGNGNTASGHYSTIPGGYQNIASGYYSTVGGGNNNTVSGIKSNIGGGHQNVVASNYSSVLGGYGNQISLAAASSSIVGGKSNKSTASYSSVVGGYLNSATTGYATVVGGQNNLASEIKSFIGNGSSGRASGRYSAILNGNTNVASGYGSLVLNGKNNTASGTFSSTLAGSNNAVAGNNSSILAGSGQTLSVDNTSLAQNFTGGTISGGTIYSGSTNLYDIFLSQQSGSSSNGSAVANGTNTYTAGTFGLTSVNVSALTINTLTVSGASQLNTTTSNSISASTITGTTLYGDANNLTSLYWKTVPGTPARVNNNSFTITDNNGTNNYVHILGRGTVLKWDDTITRMAMVHSATYASSAVTIVLMGDILSGSATMSSVKFAREKARPIVFSMPGVIAAANDIAGRFYCPYATKIFGADVFHNQSGVTNSTAYQISKNASDGTGTILSGAATIISTALSGVGFTASDSISAATYDYLTLNCISGSTTAAIDAYLNLHIFPFNNQFFI